MNTNETVIVAGGGHNGLIAACYLAREGLPVTVLERRDVVGGAVHTSERIPGFRFDTCSVAHNMINMTNIIEELDLAACGLEYIEMDPFTTALTPDGRAARFYRDLKRTQDDIARVSSAEADAYKAFIERYLPTVAAAVPALRGEPLKTIHEQALGALTVVFREGPLRAAQELLSSYGELLRGRLPGDLTRAAIAALAAHATVGPDTPAGAFYVMWQAAYHRYGMYHARGGSGMLATALRRRLEALGGRVETGCGVSGLVIREAEVRGVRLDAGGEMGASAVITTVNPRVVLTEWLPDGELSPSLLARVKAIKTSNAVQFVVHVATDRLPPFRGTEDMPDAWNGMAAMTRDLDQVGAAFADAARGAPSGDPPVYTFTPSAMDDSLAPAGKHTVYLACPAYPGRLATGTWAERGMAEAEKLIAAVEPYAPGFKQSIIDFRPWTPQEMEDEVGLINGHPMQIDLVASQLVMFRPLPGLANYRTPIKDLYLSGAGTRPAGGVLGVPGRNAARALLADRKQTVRRYMLLGAAVSAATAAAIWRLGR